MRKELPLFADTVYFLGSYIVYTCISLQGIRLSRKIGYPVIYTCLYIDDQFIV